MARTATRAARTRRRTAASVVLAALLLVPTAAPASGRSTDYKQVVDLTFPVPGRVWFTDDYKAWRGGGTRRHQATDIFAPKGTPVHAAVAGTVCWMSGVRGPEPSYGYIITLCGDDGREYNYIHLDNDRPGTDDGRGGPAAAYAPGLRQGQRVRRGQLIGFLGDSGNAENTQPHLHFEIEDPDLDDPRLDPSPWKEDRINPYRSLVRARQQGDVPSSTARLLRLDSPWQRGEDVKALQRGLASLGYRNARGRPIAIDGIFGPGTDRAARAFQRRVGLTPSGLVGPKTLGALSRALAQGERVTSGSPASTRWPGRYLRLTRPFMRGDDVRTFQRRLADLDYRGLSGRRLAVDGIWGPSTDRAARKFIADVRLPSIPIVGPRTWGRAFPG